jgi:hypothetical protein
MTEQCNRCLSTSFQPVYVPGKGQCCEFCFDKDPKRSLFARLGNLMTGEPLELNTVRMQDEVAPGDLNFYNQAS